MLTLSVSANSLYIKGTMVSRGADGRAKVPTDGDGLPVVGFNRQNIDNRTGAAFGGTDDAGDIDLEEGVFAVDYTGTAPRPGELVYAVNNFTVSVDSAGGTRGLAGYVTEPGREANQVQIYAGTLIAAIQSLVDRIYALETAP